MTIPNPLRRTALLAGLALAASLAVTGPATADSQTRDDATNDVVEWTPEPVVKPGDAKTDVTTFKTVHADQKVRLVLDVRTLAAANFDINFRIVTPTDGWLVEYTLDEDGNATTFLYVYNPARSARGGPTPCEGLTSNRVLDHDRTVINLPRNCIGSPTWVRTGAITVRYNGKAVRSDDARRGSAPTEQIKLGPEIGYN